MAIRIRSLRLVGAEKNYDASFLDDGTVRPLSVVAGEVSTGKTSILEFIAYGLGASDHPQHHEIQRRVRNVLLEVGVGDQVVVIERAAFSDRNIAHVHEASIDKLSTPHRTLTKEIDPAGSENSLSSMLLDFCGLAGIDLREAPSRSDSPAQPLSFRDILWLCFLENSRLDSRQLLFEANHMKALKLRQVIEVVFGVHDDQLTKLSDQLRAMEDRRSKRQGALDSLKSFLEENSVPGALELELRRRELEGELSDVRNELTELQHQMQAASSFASELRGQYAEARMRADTAAGEVRYYETLVRRLLPLRAQYAEDERKLHFFTEARTLFDPLHIEVCPSCLQRLPHSVTIEGGRCTLCDQNIEQTTESFDISTELTAVRARRREIDRYIEEVEESLRESKARYSQAREVEERSQRALDTDVATSLAPYVAERDHRVGERERIEAAIREVSQQESWRQGMDSRQIEIGRLGEQIQRLRKEVEKRRAAQPSKDEVIAALSSRFRTILEGFGFPKLHDPMSPYLDRNFVPHVRGIPYRDIGSAGAMTLTSLAWQLALFELAVEEGHPHPGFLMIDSPQKNLTPEGGLGDDEFADPAIGDHVWNHILSLASRFNEGAQLIVVDNKPRAQAAGRVVISYSGRRDVPPYGLIDDEVPESNDRNLGG